MGRLIIVDQVTISGLGTSPKVTLAQALGRINRTQLKPLPLPRLTTTHLGCAQWLVVSSDRYASEVCADCAPKSGATYLRAN